MEVLVSNNITIINPNLEIITWSKSNLTLPNPEYSKKLRMGFWVGNTPKTLNLYEIRGEQLVLPYGVLREILPMLQNSNVKTDFKPIENVSYNGEVSLYPYQEKALNELFKAHYGILQSKAGSGKTQIGIALINKLGLKTLWLTHTHDLLSQSKKRAERYIDKDLIGTITSGKVNIGKGITFATIQTMCKLDLSQYKYMWDLVIVDEVHRVAGTPTSMTMFSKVLNSLAARHKYGLSATIHRADGLIKATYSLVGQVVYSVPDEDVADKVLNVGVLPISTDIKVSRECTNTDGTLNYTKLISYLSENESRNRLISSYLVREKEHSCLILSDRLEHLETIMCHLPPEMQSKAVMINGKMTSKKGKLEREQAIEDMRTGKKKYLFATYSLAKEGLDIPCLERLFMATPIKDYAVVTQSIGRIARVYEGKAEPIVLDFVDNIGYLVKSYKERCRHYKKANCYFIEE